VNVVTIGTVMPYKKVIPETLKEQNMVNEAKKYAII
jgi:hypothetical protein